MRKIREVLRLKYERCCSNRDIAKICEIGRSTVSDMLQRVQKAGISWPLPDDFSDAFLENALFPSPTHSGSSLLIPEK